MIGRNDMAKIYIFYFSWSLFQFRATILTWISKERNEIMFKVNGIFWIEIKHYLKYFNIHINDIYCGI